MLKASRRILKASSVVFASLLSGLTFNTPSLAQETDSEAFSDSNTLMLEEIVVTARMRPESLQDVPASVNAVSGEKLAEAGITKIEQLSAYVPNLTMSETGIGTNIYIRGIGSGINQGFEQSVGMYVDGIYYGRAQLSRAPFMDFSQVEVLRGPQGVLFGKNSIAGAISMTTARPGDDTEAQISVLFEPELDETEVTAVWSHRFNNNFAARIALRQMDSDGHIENLTLDRDEPNREEQTARLVLDFTPGDLWDIVLKAEVSSFDIKGRQIEIPDDHKVKARDADDVRGNKDRMKFPEFIGSSWADIVSGNLATNYDIDAVYDQFGFEIDEGYDNIGVDYKRSSNGDFSDNETENITLMVSYMLGSFTLTSVTGFLAYEYEELCDCDFSAVDAINVFGEEDFDQFSQELRLLSPTEGEIEYVVGLFFQTSELEFNESLLVGSNSILGPLAEIFSGTGQFAIDKRIDRTFTQDTDIAAIFGQLNWHMTDKLVMTLGGRFTREEKEGYRLMEFLNLDRSELTGAAASLTPSVYASLFRAQPHEEIGERDESKFTPSASLQYEIDEDFMAYISYARGYKSGGFDARSNTGTEPENVLSLDLLGFDQLVAGAFEYDEEEATSVEIGAKASLADGLVEVNIAVFQTEYDDMQMSIFDGVLGFNVRNAARAETQGFEMEGRWLVAQGLILSGSFAALQFDFKEFENGQCYFEQKKTSTTGFCSYNGLTNQYVADYSAHLAIDYVTYVAGNYVLSTTVDFNYTDDYNPSQNLDPSMIQDAYTAVNARISIGNENDNWNLALIGKNLTDEEIITYANDTPVASGSVEAKGHYAFVAPPRTVAIQATYKY